MTPRHEYNWRCPNCGSRDEISLVVHVDAQINDGEMEYTAPPMWPPDAQVFCGECGHEGVPADSRQISEGASNHGEAKPSQ